MRFSLVLVVFLAVSIPTLAHDSFKIDDCILKNGSNSETDILKVVSVQENEYITYSYFLTRGKLVQGKDYVAYPKAAIDQGYSRSKCPIYDSTFSPEKYLDSKQNK